MPIHYKVTDTKRDHILLRCESMNEMMNLSRQNWNKFHFWDSENDFLGRSSFIGRSDIGSWDKIEKAMSRPWDKGVDLINKMVQEIIGAGIPKPKSRKRRPRWSEDVGDEVDYDRIRSGQPFWRESKRQITTSAQTIVMVADIGGSCGTDADQLVWRGATMLAAAYLLEQAGYRCELWSCYYFLDLFREPFEGTRDLVPICRIKQASERIDIGTIASGVSGWFYRTIMFGVTQGFTLCSGGLGKGGEKPSNWFPTEHIAGSGQPHLIIDVWDLQAAIAVARELIAVVQDPKRDRVFVESGKRRPFYEWNGQKWRQQLQATGKY